MTVNEYNTLSFPKLGWEFVVKSEAFSIFGFSIKWYGLMIGLGLLLALIYCFRRMKSFGVDSDRAFDTVFGGLIGAFVGARAYFVLMSWDDYKDNLSSIFNFREGGLAIYGGLIGAVLVGGIVAKVRKCKFMPLLDLAGMGFLIGQCLGRWGNFFNHECFGGNTTLPWGMTSPKIAAQINAEAASILANTGVTVNPSLPVHPCFFYESLWCALGFLVLHLYSKHRKFDGELFFMYLGWYGLGRMVIEGMRTDSLMVGNFRASQLFAGICVVVSLIVVFAKRRSVTVNGYTFYKDTEEFKTLLAESEAKEQKYLDKKNAKKTVKSSKYNAPLNSEDKLVDDLTDIVDGDNSDVSETSSLNEISTGNTEEDV